MKGRKQGVVSGYYCEVHLNLGVYCCGYACQCWVERMGFDVEVVKSEYYRSNYPVLSILTHSWTWSSVRKSDAKCENYQEFLLRGQFQVLYHVDGGREEGHLSENIKCRHNIPADLLISVSSLH